MARKHKGPGHAKLRLRRSWHFASPIIDFLRSDACRAQEKAALDQLIRELDADPIARSVPLLGRVPPGMRSASFGSHILIVRFDPLDGSTGKVWCLTVEPLIP